MSIRRTLAAALLAALPLLAMPDTASAQQICAPRDALVRDLQKNYAEAPSGRGLSGAGDLIELLTGPNGSWTMLLVKPTGIACVIGVGEAWHDVPLPASVSEQMS